MKASFDTPILISMEMLLTHSSYLGCRIAADRRPKRRTASETLLMHLAYEWSRDGRELIVTEVNSWLRESNSLCELRPERSNGIPMENTLEQRRIAHRIVCGPVTATIWSTEDIDQRSFTVTVTRPGDEESPQLERDDLLPLARLLDEAHTWILRQSIEAGRSESLAI